MNTTDLLSEQQQQRISHIVEHEGKVGAMRYMREVTGCDLPTAKNYVESKWPAAPAFANTTAAQWPAALMILVVGAVIATCMFSSGTGTSAAKQPDPTANSDYDGSVPVVKRYLRQNLKDPDSYQAIEWSSVRPLEDGKLCVRHKYRAKNSFGGYVIEDRIFFFDKSGKVYAVENVPTR